MEHCAIFIDEGHWRKTLQDFGYVKVDLRRLSLFLADGCPILRTYYYGCMPYLSHNPTDDELRAFANKERYINAIKRLSKYEVWMGRLAPRGKDEYGNKTFIQKGVDVKLTTDLVMLATSGAITKAILLTCDGDYLPAMQAAKNAGVEIKLCHGSAGHPHESLLKIADEVLQIDEHIVKAIQIRY